MTKSTIFRLAELFCGPGGLSLGAIRSRIMDHFGNTYEIDPVWANDIDQNTCKTYSLNIHHGNNQKVYCADVKQLNFNEMPSFNALAFGFPCNDFSVIGEQKGFNGHYGPLYSYGIKAIECRNPEWFIAENVSGLRSANNGMALTKILHDLENAGNGYNITPHLYRFEQYGVPQTRHRIVIIGIRKDLNLKFLVPTPTTQYNYISAKDAIENPPIKDGEHNHEVVFLNGNVAERLKYIPPGENAWYPGIPVHLRLNVKGAKLSQIYKRLNPDKPSYTITGSGGGGTHGYHWSENRELTNRERARIQTFPDDFIFVGSKENVRRQIGMAVPPKVAQIIIESILKTFGNISYEHIEQNII